MAKVEHTSDACVLVGIDISKNRHEVLIAAPGKTRRRRMTVLNTAEDYRRLIDALLGFGLPVTVGFEATDNYHRALMFALAQALQHEAPAHEPRRAHAAGVPQPASKGSNPEQNQLLNEDKSGSRSKI